MISDHQLEAALRMRVPWFRWVYCIGGRQVVAFSRDAASNPLRVKPETVQRLAP